MSSKRNDATSRRSRLGSKQSPVRKHTRFALSPTLSEAAEPSTIVDSSIPSGEWFIRSTPLCVTCRRTFLPPRPRENGLSHILPAWNALSDRRSRLPDRTPTDTAINGACVSSRLSTVEDDDTEECEPPSIPPLQLVLSNSSRSVARIVGVRFL